MTLIRRVLNKSSKLAHQSACWAEGREMCKTANSRYRIELITEVVLVPKYASVEARQVLWAMRQHPKRNTGLRWLREIGTRPREVRG